MARERKISEQLNLVQLEKEKMYDGKTRRALSELRRPVYPNTFNDSERKREDDSRTQM